MTVHDGAGCGSSETCVERVILARELSWEEIKAICAENRVEVEVLSMVRSVWPIRGLPLQQFGGRTGGNRGVVPNLAV